MKRDTIFRPVKKGVDKEKRWKIIHWDFKLKFFTPAMYFINKYVGKFIIKERHEIPQRKYNVNFLILWDAYEEASKEWREGFLNIVYSDPRSIEAQKEFINKIVPKKKWFFRTKFWNYFLKKTYNCRKFPGRSYIIPKFFLRFMITMILEDTAYRELFNKILFKIQGKMNQVWNPEIQHKFPMYVGKYDCHRPYFAAWEQVEISYGGIEIENKE